ncbi:MAG: hypothetical protein KDI36_13035 [Pseudomonadales bacterium]|nr:hypothetical protein [Pseudomonadales bacterium]
MELALFVRIAVLFLVFLATLGLNLGDNLMARLGFDGNLVLVLLTATVFTFFVAGRHAMIVAAVIVFSLITNMPSDFSLNFGYDRDYYAGIMLALVFQPLLMRALD